jgi:hypothetical protein
MSSESPLFEQSRSILSHSQDRPTPQYMAQLITCGLTEQVLSDTWDSLGNPQPVMAESLADLDGLLPYIHIASDTLGNSGDNEALLFAARDAESLYDDYAITHGERNERDTLLPASTAIWRSRVWSDPELSRAFLRAYGVDEEFITDPNARVTIVDSGFEGSLLMYLDEVVSEAYDIRLHEAGRLAIKLACATPIRRYRIGQIVGTGALEHPTQNLPKTSRFMGRSDEPNLGPTYPYAIALQLLPHYHGHYVGIAYKEGKAVGIIEPVTADINVDVPKSDSGSLNTSFVNPLAAAIVQHRVVSAAMNRAT